MVRLCGAVLGLFAFAVAIFRGLLADNPIDVTLIRSVKAMFLFCVIGLCVGWVAQRVLDEHARRHHGEIFKEVDEDEIGEAATQVPIKASPVDPGRPGKPSDGQAVAGS
ncbi:MAG TPA: hypothetical protein VLM89_11005 [Phycisphaerae bacterium]|nr:hypothetical protein [Phycisphaerae bacterium]